MQAARFTVGVAFISACTVQCVPVFVAHWRVDKAECRAPLLNAGDGDAKLAGVFDELARAVNRINQPVISGGILVHRAVGFFAETGQVNDAR